MTRSTISLVAATAAIAFASPASATLLEGKTVTYQYYFPNPSSPYASASNGNYVVGPGVEVGNIASAHGSMNISDTNIFIDYTNTSAWNSAVFNGWELSDTYGTIDAITSVTINAATNMVGFDASRISFDADHIFVNWQGLGFNANTVVSLDIGGGAAVPEPDMIGLFGIGGFGLLGSRRRKAR